MGEIQIPTEYADVEYSQYIGGLYWVQHISNYQRECRDFDRIMDMVKESGEEQVDYTGIKDKEFDIVSGEGENQKVRKVKLKDVQAYNISTHMDKVKGAVQEFYELSDKVSGLVPFGSLSTLTQDSAPIVGTEIRLTTIDLYKRIINIVVTYKPKLRTRGSKIRYRGQKMRLPFMQINKVMQSKDYTDLTTQEVLASFKMQHVMKKGIDSVNEKEFIKGVYGHQRQASEDYNKSLKVIAMMIDFRRETNPL